MHRMRVWAELSDQWYDELDAEAKRQGKKLETLVQDTVNNLIKELEDERKDGLVSMS